MLLLFLLLAVFFQNSAYFTFHPAEQNMLLMACNFTKAIVFNQVLRIKLFCLLPTMMEKNCESFERDLEKKIILGNFTESRTEKLT